MKVLSGLLLFLPIVALAQVEPKEYFERLGVVQKALNNQRTHDVMAGGSAARAVLPLEKRAYKLNETWTMEFTPLDNVDVRKSESPEDFVAVIRKPIIFDFKVIDVGAKGDAQIEVRQRVGGAVPPVDPKVDHLVLAMSPQYVLLKKTVYFRDGRVPATVTGNGRGNVALGFSGYPVDLPDLNSLEGESLGGGELEFHFEDLYARPMRAIWKSGEVWPRYVQSSAGTVVRGGRHE